MLSEDGGRAEDAGPVLSTARVGPLDRLLDDAKRGEQLSSMVLAFLAPEVNRLTIFFLGRFSSRVEEGRLPSLLSSSTSIW